MRFTPRGLLPLLHPNKREKTKNGSATVLLEGSWGIAHRPAFRFNRAAFFFHALRQRERVCVTEAEAGLDCSSRTDSDQRSTLFWSAIFVVLDCSVCRSIDFGS